MFDAKFKYLNCGPWLEIEIMFSQLKCSRFFSIPLLCNFLLISVFDFFLFPFYFNISNKYRHKTEKNGGISFNHIQWLLSQDIFSTANSCFCEITACQEQKRKPQWIINDLWNVSCETSSRREHFSNVTMIKDRCEEWNQSTNFVISSSQLK